jgi:hypothetical protein
MHLVNQSNLPPAVIAEIEAAISNQENLLDVMQWAARSPDEFLPTVVANVVVQDEFTHDVIVPWRDLALVYDTT